MLALGWLGWTEQQSLAADVNAIVIAYDGRMDMFKAVGWVTEKAEQLPEFGPGMLSRR